MKQLIDFIPLLLFFVVYKLTPQNYQILGYDITLGGIYSATAVLIAASLMVYGTLLLIHKKLDKGQWLTLGGCLFFGGLTLGLHDETFLKWKAPVVSWVFGIAFLVSQWVGQKPLVQRLLDHILTLPPNIWKQLNLMWALFFLLSGAINLWVAFTFESIWVEFKIFGSMGMMILFMVAQGIWLSPYLRQNPPDSNTKTKND